MFNQLSFEQTIKCQILHTVSHISGERLKEKIEVDHSWESFEAILTDEQKNRTIKGWCDGTLLMPRNNFFFHFNIPETNKKNHVDNANYQLRPHNKTKKH